MYHYYLVEAKCGHFGKNKYVLKFFPVIAENGTEAAHIVRNMPRVKHHQKDAIRLVVEITYDDYVLCKYWADVDPYFKCTCIQEQRMFCNENVYEEYEEDYSGNEMCSNRHYYLGKKSIRNPKKYNHYVYHG